MNRREFLEYMLIDSEKFDSSILDKLDDEKINYIFEGFISAIKHKYNNVSDHIKTGRVTYNMKNVLNCANKNKGNRIGEKICILNLEIKRNQMKMNIARRRFVDAVDKHDNDEMKHQKEKIADYKKKINQTRSKIASLK
jgi:hypothetical protein